MTSKKKKIMYKKADARRGGQRSSSVVSGGSWSLPTLAGESRDGTYNDKVVNYE